MIIDPSMRKYFLQHDPAACRKAIQLYSSGLSIWAVGEKIGYSGQSINRLLAHRHIKRRHGIMRLGTVKINKGRARIKTKKGWVSRARLVASKLFGKKAIIGRHVHHVDENPLNDRPGNLKPLTPSKHRSLTNRGKKMRAAAKKGAAIRWSKQ